MKNPTDLISLFELMVGDKSNISKGKREEISILEETLDLGYSQFNEILLHLGFNRIHNSFFQFLVNGEIEYEEGSSIKTIKSLEAGVHRFIELALLWYGNIKFAYKKLSKDPYELFDKVSLTTPYDENHYTGRHQPITEIRHIEEDKTWLLGYLSIKKLQERIKKDKNDIEAEALLKERNEIIKIGKRNQTAYLTSDHMDVYVATSMRLEHEFLFVSRLITKVFFNKNLSDLKIRWFDPTQAYCEDRIDKGLSEALMLKRAKCTLYLAQETDTLGKDSELASTLAQGKPVVAFVPNGNKKFVNELIADFKKIHPQKNKLEIIKEQLEVFSPSLAWRDKRIISWLSAGSHITVNEAMGILYEAVKGHYDNRAKTLKDNHPLGIQVNLSSGVANGVLVVRNESDCAKLIRLIIMNDMQFIINFKNNHREKNVYLREKISKSIFRVKTGNRLLDNSFWNFYTEPNY